MSKQYMIAFKFSCKHTSTWEVYKDQILKVQSEILLKQILQKKWCELIWYIEEIEIEDTFIEKIQNWFKDTFSTSTWYNVDRELTVLDAYATALRDGMQQKEAFASAKTMFWKSDKASRDFIDRLIATFDESWNRWTADVFAKNHEYFSKDFINMIEQAQKNSAEIKFHDLISNPASPEEKWRKVEWYVELTRWVHELMIDIKKSISGPLKWLWFMLLFVWAILVYVLPGLLDSFAQMRDISWDSYYGIWEITLAISRFVTDYWIYIIGLLLLVVWIFTFFYTHNNLFKAWVHRYLCKMYMIWDIISLIYSKRIVSLVAVYFNSWMRQTSIFKNIIELTNMIPIKEELKIISDWLAQWKTFDSIFRSYPEDERYLTEMFYLQLAQESNSNGTWITGRFGKAYAMILKNIDDLWKKSISQMPEKLWKYIRWGWMWIVVFFVIWILLIFVATLTNSV